MERYIAVDNVCAWPCLTQAPDGTLLATLFDQPTHGGCEGDTACWVSEDEGRSWQFRGTAMPHEPGTNSGMNHAAGFAGDGGLVVITSGRDNRPPVGTIVSADKSRILPPVVCRSHDAGRTWVRDGQVENPPGFENPPIAFGPIQIVDKATLGVPMHSDKNLYYYTSGDEGRTWQMGARIAAGNYNESCLCTLTNGRLLVAARTYGDQHLELFISDDVGRSWRNTGPLTLAGQIPGNLLQLKNGRILLTFSLRNPGLRGIGYRWSEDNGETWGRPGLLLDFEMITDGGYPSSVELCDGTIVTVYYAGAIPAHRRYHMGVLRWTPEQLKDPGAFTQSYAGGKVWNKTHAGIESAISDEI